MTVWVRYALYYVPPAAAPLYTFGARLLGYDAFKGVTLPVPRDVARAVPDWEELSRAPRAYGFHATLKAPFHLAAGVTEAELRAACEGFAAAPRAIPVVQPVVQLVGGFVAVVPAQASDALARLAAACVETFDPFRGPLTEADRARRNPAALVPRQVANLDRWGYPYVMEDFRFHMTLTGRLPPERQVPILALLRDRFAVLGLRALAIDRLALLRQDAVGSPFRLLAQWPLRPAGASDQSPDAS